MPRIQLGDFSKIVDSNGERVAFFKHSDGVTHVLKTREEVHKALRAFCRKHSKAGETEEAAERRLCFYDSDPEGVELYQIYQMLPAEKQETVDQESYSAQTEAEVEIAKIAKGLLARGEAKTIADGWDKALQLNPGLYKRYQMEMQGY